MSTVAEIIEAVKRLDEREKHELLDRLADIEFHDPLEPFIGCISSGGGVTDWVECHDAHLGKDVLNEQQRDG